MMRVMSRLATTHLKTDTRPQPRIPAATLAIGFALGIWLDSWLRLPTIGWTGMTTLVLAIWMIAWQCKRNRLAAGLMLLACLAAGGLRHHIFWSVRAENDISRFAVEDHRPVRLTGRITSQPVILPRIENEFPSAIPSYDRTLCTLSCDALISANRRIPVTGQIRLEVTGHLLHINHGDEVDVAGILSAPQAADNPGGFDFQSYLRRQDIVAIVRTDYPDSVRLLRAHSRWLSPLRYFDGLRRECEQILHARLSPRNAPIGIALLLGNRTEVDELTRSAFAESGTMHFLALSGLHVGILALLLWSVCRLLHLSGLATSCTVIGCLIGYALLSEARPPVVRATVMTAIFLAGRPWQRRAPLENSLAIAALLLLLWNPSQLFDIGPQLSFLAVIAIAACARFRPFAPDDEPPNATDPTRLPSERMQQLHRLFGPLLRGVGRSYLVVAAIWLFTLPLIAARFHLVSPVGFLINVILMPLVIFVLWSGYLLLFCGLLLPPLASVFAVGFDIGLSLFLHLVDWAADVRCGHVYVPGPGNWWLGAFYALLFTAAFARQWQFVRKWSVVALLIWISVGLGSALWQPRDGNLRCTFLSVGHGCAVLLEMPGGRTLLYDAGQLHNARRAERVVENALWERGIGRLDAVVLSHADVDHFNAIPDITNKLPTGAVFFSPTFLDFDQSSVVALCDALAAQGLTPRLIGADDTLTIDDQVRVRVLHPAANSQISTDNANSIVLAIEYRGRRILLTGDLEGEGLNALLDRPKTKFDVVLAPHHGSLGSNTAGLAEWCSPDWVIISGGRRNSAKLLEEIYGPKAQILSTWTSGAVTVVVDDGGDIDVQPFLERQ